MHITEAISSYAQDKVEGDLSDFPRVESAHVVLDVEKYRHIAEIFVQGANHLRIEGKSESDDMYVSIDGAVEKVVRQLRKARDKVQSHKNQQSLAEAEIEAVEAEKE
jgi:putative sigma-54 modulation protein